MISKKRARELGLSSLNIRCNYCGSYGAKWIPNMRPGWGCVALCPRCENELKEAIAGYIKAINKFKAINFEQDKDEEQLRSNINNGSKDKKPNSSSEN